MERKKLRRVLELGFAKRVILQVLSPSWDLVDDDESECTVVEYVLGEKLAKPIIITGASLAVGPQYLRDESGEQLFSKIRRRHDVAIVVGVVEGRLCKNT